MSVNSTNEQRVDRLEQFGIDEFDLFSVWPLVFRNIVEIRVGGPSFVSLYRCHLSHPRKIHSPYSPTWACPSLPAWGKWRRLFSRLFPKQQPVCVLFRPNRQPGGILIIDCPENDADGKYEQQGADPSFILSRCLNPERHIKGNDRQAGENKGVIGLGSHDGAAEDHFGTNQPIRAVMMAGRNT